MLNKNRLRNAGIRVKNNELISIIVPVYKAENYIEKTLYAIFAQTYENWEAVLVVDGSVDRSEAIIREVLKKEGREDQVQILIREKNQGAARARNMGVEKARGRYIAYLDADDYWPSEKLSREIAFLKEKDAGFVFTGYEFGDEEANPTGKIVKVPATLTYKEALKNTTIFTTTVMFDTEKIPKELLVMPEVKSEDTALWWKILRKGYVAYGLDENLAVYRRPAKSLSSNKLEAIRRIWNLYRKVEGLSIPYSCYNFCFWAFRAVYRRV